MNVQTCDYLIVGGGVIGLNIARHLRHELPDAEIVVIDKETAPGGHASGRNSGVIHAGFYYSADSLKARFTKVGNQQLTAYCEAKGIPINKCGKLVVAQNDAELTGLDVLKERAARNGVELQEIDAYAAQAIEPRIKAYGGRALFSPTTSSIDPHDVLRCLVEDLKESGVSVRYGERFIRWHDGQAVTNNAVYAPGYLINCAGLYADVVARELGFCRDYRILPFKGLYVYGREPHGSVRTNIYPVPDLAYPFLGVHFTVTVKGDVKVGPTAIPTLWREQYGGLSGFSLSECVEVVARQVGLFFNSGFAFKQLAVTELRKMSRHRLAMLAGGLVHGIDPQHFRTWGKPGIRAQLMNIRTRKLEMDFITEGDARSFHVLNSISPAFTCSIPLARHIVDEVLRLQA